MKRSNFLKNYEKEQIICFIVIVLIACGSAIWSSFNLFSEPKEKEMNYLVETTQAVYDQYKTQGLIEEPEGFCVSITATKLSVSSNPLKVNFCGKATATIENGKLSVVGKGQVFDSIFLSGVFGFICGVIAFIIYKLLIEPLYCHIRYSRS